MERIVSKGILHADGRLDFQGDLEGIDPASYKNLEMFKGIAATTDTTMNLFRHSEGALQQLADAYTYGKGMYTDHYLKFSNRIGRTLKGVVNDGALEVVFGIRPNLDISNSNDLISIVRDTGADLSASYYPERISCGVEGCGKDMEAHGFFFFSWYECEEGHCVGDVYENDDGEKVRVAGVIESIEDVVELSLVSVGANIDTEVTGEVQAQVADKVGDDLTFLRFLSESNGLNFDNVCLKFGMDTHKPGDVSPGSHAPNRNKPTPGGSPMPQGIIKDFSNPDMQLIEDSDENDLLEIVREFAAHIKTQDATIGEMKPAAEYETLATEFAKQKKELEQAKRDNTAAAEKVTGYDAEVKYWQDACIGKKQKVRSYSDDDPRLLEYAKSIRKITDIHELRSKTVGHSDTIQALGGVKEFMELKTPSGKQPEVTSDY